MWQLVVSVVFFSCLGISVGQKCVFLDSCSCRFDMGAGSEKYGVEGGIIDLHRINDDGDPLFVDPKDSGGKLFFYSPCSPYPCPAMEDSSVCLTNKATKQTSDLGNLQGLTFNTTVTADESKIHTSLNYKIKGSKVTSEVHLICSKSNEFRFERNTSTKYEFTLYSPCACVDGCIEGISAGSVLLIIFFSTMVVYFVLGCIYKKAVLGATGQELVPNDKFWFSLPGLVKDGYIFFISPCLGDRADNRVYDRL